MTRLGKIGIVTFLFVAATGSASSTETCNTESGWKRVRASYPMNAQVLASCRDQTTGQTIIVLTEPPSHITRDKADPIVRALFASPIVSVERRRHQLGFDGWAEDLVIAVDTRTPQSQGTLSDDLALLATLAFGSAYKAEVENIDDLQPPSIWQAPSAINVSKEEISTWLLGAEAQLLTPVGGDDHAPLVERIARNETGTYYSASPGLVVAIMPGGSAGQLNDHIEALRHFVIDSDSFIGAINFGNRVALIGRERTTTLANSPPLRLETILLLASERSAQLAQSYERRRVFAGKLPRGTEDLAGWDWAPILLSDSLVDTEFGSLLNFTDNMLKSWSEAGLVDYKGFPHSKPVTFPFGQKTVRDFISEDQGLSGVTYNWNTAGVGLISRSSHDIFVVSNTGSLPVSYFPEGSDQKEDSKKRLVEAEDKAYAYFRSLRNPSLARAVQYAGLYQAFQAFDVRARRPDEPAPPASLIHNVENILSLHVNSALNHLMETGSPLNRELVAGYIDFINSKQQGSEKKAVSDNDIKVMGEFLRRSIARVISDLDAEYSQQWRELLSKLLSRGHLDSSNIKSELSFIYDKLEFISDVGIPISYNSNVVRREVVARTDHSPHGWIKTPSIVVSKHGDARLVGGHNIGGRATRVEIDPSLPKGRVKISGSYEDGRILRLSPADASAERDLVRLFDREVGLRDSNQSKAAQAVEARLRASPPPVAGPPRTLSIALESPSTRTVRGAIVNPKSEQIGYRPASADSFTPQITANFDTSGAHILVAPSPPGFTVIRSLPLPPSVVKVPNTTSLHEAVDVAALRASKGPPAVTNLKVGFVDVSRSDVARHIEAMADRGKRMAGAGGKPPFGGDRPAFAFPEGPQSNRPVTTVMTGRSPPSPKFETNAIGRAWDQVRSLFGKRRPKIRSEAANASIELAAKPHWSEATLRFPTIDEVQIIGIPTNPGHLHIVEVTVPMVTSGSRPPSLFIRAVAWLGEKPTTRKIEDVKSATNGLFKTADSIDVEEALVRYKEIMLNHFGTVDNFHFNIQREGIDIIVVELCCQEYGSRG